jgi:hypothetical protein
MEKRLYCCCRPVWHEWPSIDVVSYCSAWLEVNLLVQGRPHATKASALDDSQLLSVIGALQC